MSELKDIAIVLKLKADATAAQIKKAVEQLIKDYKAQCETGIKCSNEINNLNEKIIELEKTLLVSTAGTEDLLEKINQLEDELISEMNKNGQSDKDVISLQKVASTYLKEHKDVQEIYVTIDGSVFMQHSFANNHTKVVGGKVVQFKRNND